MEICEEWDMTIPPIPPRSRLYRLEPIGIGTPYVECLTSYIARLAKIHHVLPKELVKREIMPLLGMEVTDPNFYYRLNTFFSRDSQSINGTGLMAERWIEALQTLTSRDDLHFLTMFMWSEVIALKRLQKANKAWCIQCYEESFLSHQKVYDYLLWTLNGVDVCPLHQRRLVTKCSSCQKPQPFLSKSTFIGYCAYCRSWLGDISKSLAEDQVPSVNYDLNKQVWIASCVGELLASAPDISVKPLKEHVARIIKICLKKYSRGSISALARLFGITAQTVWGYLYKGSVPYFEFLLRMCLSLSISPLEFFKLDVVHSLSTQNVELDYLAQPIRNRRKWEHVKDEDVQGIRLYLEAILTKNSASLPTLKEVAIELGCNVKLLRRHCSELSKPFLSQRRNLSEEFFKSAQTELEDTLASTEPVPLSNVMQHLGYDREVMERYFPDLCRKIVTRYQERFDYQKIRKCLQDAIADDKTTSVAEIAGNLGYKSSFLYSSFPDLCKQIATQRRVRLKKQHENRVENTRVEIKQAMTVLHEQGIFPSDRRIKSMLSDPHMIRRKEGRETLRIVLEEFGYSTNNVGGSE